MNTNWLIVLRCIHEIYLSDTCYWLILTVGKSIKYLKWKQQILMYGNNTVNIISINIHDYLSYGYWSWEKLQSNTLIHVMLSVPSLSSGNIIHLSFSSTIKNTNNTVVSVEDSIPAISLAVAMDSSDVFWLVVVLYI